VKVLAVDPGLRKIGLAVSDPTGTVARALDVFERGLLEQDCRRILETADREKAEWILVGNSHEPGTKQDEQARSTHRLLAVLRASAAVPVETCDESFSTQRAQEVRRERADRRKIRRTADDALAAAAFLQEYLDAKTGSTV
jgi:putative Holliday junction resolvase